MNWAISAEILMASNIQSVENFGAVQSLKIFHALNDLQFDALRENQQFFDAMNGHHFAWTNIGIKDATHEALFFRFKF